MLEWGKPQDLMEIPRVKTEEKLAEVGSTQRMSTERQSIPSCLQRPVTVAGEPAGTAQRGHNSSPGEENWDEPQPATLLGTRLSLHHDSRLRYRWVF